jgi:hypothetical protein
MSQDGAEATVDGGTAADLRLVTDVDIERLQSDRVCERINEVDRFSGLTFSNDLRKVLLRAWQLAAQLNSHTVAVEHLVVALDVTSLDLALPSPRPLPTVPPRPLLTGALYSLSLMQMDYTINLSALRPSPELEVWIDEARQHVAPRRFLDVGDLTQVLNRTDASSIGKKLDQANTASELFAARRYVRSNEQTLSRFRSAALLRLANIDKGLRAIPVQPAVPINLDALQHPIDDIHHRVKQLRPPDLSAITNGLSTVETGLADVKSHTQPLNTTLSQQGETLISHGKRLAALDQTAAQILASLPPKAPSPPSDGRLALYVASVLALGIGAGLALQAAKEAGVVQQLATLWTAGGTTPLKQTP